MNCPILSSELNVRWSYFVFEFSCILMYTLFKRAMNSRCKRWCNIWSIFYVSNKPVILGSVILSSLVHCVYIYWSYAFFQIPLCKIPSSDDIVCMIFNKNIFNLIFTPSPSTPTLHVTKHPIGISFTSPRLFCVWGILLVLIFVQLCPVLTLLSETHYFYDRI